MFPNQPNSDANGGAVLTLVRLLGSENSSDSEPEFEEAHYSDWEPKKRNPANALRRNSVVSGVPSVIFLRDGIEVSQKNIWANLPFALSFAMLMLYAVPTTLELFASQHFNPWISTIVPGNVAGCLWLATISRMRLLGLVLYIFLASCESGLYAFALLDAESLLWMTDLVPALLVAGVMTTRSKRCYS